MQTSFINSAAAAARTKTFEIGISNGNRSTIIGSVVQVRTRRTNWKKKHCARSRTLTIFVYRPWRYTSRKLLLDNNTNLKIDV